ncbi:unnamed protein product [Cylicocyclus nassatus]|uniref:Uncharacterized protein n=1 Tax=Cylicocyclus nassatus TaxID=53992 RepID=A0AA36MA85_CYLNA|nr:unnamed protein product [Cylicocyclus nassatus]
MLLQVFVVLSVATTTSAITCYNGAVYNNSAAPKDQQACPLATYCTKITALMPTPLASYGCDQSASLCKTVSCYDNQNGGRTCCCATDLCNFSTIQSAELVTVIAFVMMLL